MIDITKWISVTEYYEHNPESNSFGDNAVQTAINNSAWQLDGLCNGLIQEVLEYNQVDPQITTQFIPDPENPLYRNATELENIKQAFFAQTQFFLSMGNDYSQGSEQFNIGSTNASFSRPIDRDTYAPVVKWLLQKARVYMDISLLNTNKISNTPIDPIDPSQKCITFNQGDARYLKKIQNSASAGYLAVISPQHEIIFKNPNEIIAGSETADKILDPKTNKYVPINNVTDIAFFGKDLNQAMTRREITDSIGKSFLVWQPGTNYIKDQTVEDIKELPDGSSELGIFISLQNNIGKKPYDSPSFWKLLNTVEIPIADIIETATENVLDVIQPQFDNLSNEIDTKFVNLSNNIGEEFVALENTLTAKLDDDVEAINQGLVIWQENIENVEIPSQIEEGLNSLPTVDVILFHKGTRTLFRNLSSFTEVKIEYNIQDSDYLIEYVNGDAVLQGENSLPIGSNTLNSTNIPEVPVFIEKTNVENLFTSDSSPAGIRGVKYDIINPISNFQIYAGNKNPTPFLPKGRESFIVTWLKDIVKKGVVRDGRLLDYTGIEPIVVDNTAYTIAFDENVLNNFDSRVTDNTNRIDAGTAVVQENKSNIELLQSQMNDTIKKSSGIDQVMYDNLRFRYRGGIIGPPILILEQNTKILDESGKTEWGDKEHIPQSKIKELINDSASAKQDTLVAGENITITGNIISSTGGGGGSTYTGVREVEVDNTVNEIGLKQSFIDSVAINAQNIADLNTDISENYLNTKTEERQWVEGSIFFRSLPSVVEDPVGVNQVPRKIYVDNLVRDSIVGMVKANENNEWTAEQDFLGSFVKLGENSTRASNPATENDITNKRYVDSRYDSLINVWNTADFETIIATFPVTWVSQTSAVSAGTNLKQIMGDELFNDVWNSRNEKYVIRCLTFHNPGESTLNIPLEMRSASAGKYKLTSAVTVPYIRADNPDEGVVMVNASLQSDINGNVRFYVHFNGEYSTSFRIFALQLWKLKND